MRRRERDQYVYVYYIYYIARRVSQSVSESWHKRRRAVTRGDPARPAGTDPRSRSLDPCWATEETPRIALDFVIDGTQKIYYIKSRLIFLQCWPPRFEKKSLIGIDFLRPDLSVK